MRGTTDHDVVMIKREALVSAILMALLLTVAISFSMTRSSEDTITLALHYPLFLLLSLVAVHAVRGEWWKWISVSSGVLATGGLVALCVL